MLDKLPDRHSGHGDLVEAVAAFKCSVISEHSKSPRLFVRILNFHESYSTAYGGGAAAYVRDTCRMLADRGHDVSVVVPEKDLDDYAVSEDKVGGVRVFRVGLRYFETHDPEGWLLTPSAYQNHETRFWKALQSVLAATTPDVAIMHFARPFGESFLGRIADLGTPVVAMLHDAWAICQRYQMIQSPQEAPCSGPALGKCALCVYSDYDHSPIAAVLLAPLRVVRRGSLRFRRLQSRRAVARRITSYIALSDHMFRTFSAVFPARTVRIPLGIDLEGLALDRPRRPRVPFRFGFVGGFQPHKGVWDVFLAAQSIKRLKTPFEVHVWGPTQDGQQATVDSMGLTEHVRLRGLYPLEERWRAYEEMDVLIMATTFVEPFGRVIGEAAAAGVPSIAPAIGGITEQIRHGVDGLLFEFKNSEALAGHMSSVLNPATFEKLSRGLRPVLDTREAVIALESHLLGLCHLA
jgi:glycosyltransferase involved in cell wall biosynthesis